MTWKYQKRYQPTLTFLTGFFTWTGPSTSNLWKKFRHFAAAIAVERRVRKAFLEISWRTVIFAESSHASHVSIRNGSSRCGRQKQGKFVWHAQRSLCTNCRWRKYSAFSSRQTSTVNAAKTPLPGNWKCLHRSLNSSTKPKPKRLKREKTSKIEK